MPKQKPTAQAGPPAKEKKTSKPPDTEMSIWSHLEELRGRLVKILIGLIVTTLVSLIAANQLMVLLAIPIGGLENLQSIEVTENVAVFMRISVLAGFILALPFTLYQVMAFVSPGLKKNERRWIFLSIPFATILFAGGVLFAYFVMLPAAVPFLVSFMGVETVPRLSNYMSFILNIIFWMGVCFEIPLVMFILAKLKLITARQMLKHWRIAIIASAVLAAVISPTIDPVNMILLMAPLIGLYLLSIVLAALAV
ncbi:MAG: twin-arginine translocase subunit TatC [Anaerolineaceae bacterium]|jgi:sec-independent protein translocase protein TatC|nr:twin-arginine translocase subunit TatC [Anaerolineaceae bacterium]